MAEARARFFDGINFDFENEVAPRGPEREIFTAIVQETAEAFHSELPGSHVRASKALCERLS